MNSHDEPNCFCCPEPIKLGIKHRLIVSADNHGNEELNIILFHRHSWALPLASVYNTAYFIFQENYRLLES